MTTLADLMTCKHPDTVIHPLTEGGQLPALTLRACRACGSIHLGKGGWQRPALLEAFAKAQGTEVPPPAGDDTREQLRDIIRAAGLRGRLTFTAPGVAPLTVDVD